MKLPISWLSEFIDFDLSKEKLADIFTSLGHQVEGIDDEVLDLEITPNRSDCLSVLGLARELSVKTNIPFKIPKQKISDTETPEKIDIKIEDFELCPRFCARIISIAKIGPSPDFIQKRLKQMGIRPINNVVDITNYVMLERGQPLHAFDYDKIMGQKMTVRQAKDGEKLTTLDGQTYNLDRNSIVIEDGERLIDLAGIMGGENSAVSDKTSKIVIQAAIFNPVLIRRTSKKLSLQTEASYRYERGVDFEGTISALDCAAQLIEKYAGGKVRKLIDIKKLLPGKIIDFSPQKISKLLGTEIPSDTMIDILKRLGLTIKRKNDFYQTKIPSWRLSDLKNWQDLAEEIARIYGYEKLRVAEIPKVPSTSKISNHDNIVYIKSLLNNLGFTEVYTYSYLSQKDLEYTTRKTDNLWEIQNPISEEQKYLRPTLYPGLLKVFQKNPWNKGILIFEIGQVFPSKNESLKIELGLGGSLQNQNVIKEALNKISNEIGGRLETKIFKPDTQILSKFKIRRPAVFYTISLSEIVEKIHPSSLVEIELSENKYRPISKFPPVLRDISIIVNSNIKISALVKEIKKLDNLVWEVELFDKFKSEKFGKDKISLAFHIFYQSFKKTLNDGEIEPIHEKITNLLTKDFGAQLRSKQ